MQGQIVSDSICSAPPPRKPPAATARSHSYPPSLCSSAGCKAMRTKQQKEIELLAAIKAAADAARLAEAFSLHPEAQKS